VERQIESAVKADAKLEQAKRRGQDPRGVAGHAGRAWRKAERLFDEAVQVQEALEQIKEALGACPRMSITGSLNLGLVCRLCAEIGQGP
jgi:hypothetical protein